MNLSMKIYIVESHEDMQWSDQDSSIDAVFSTRELAEKYIRHREEKQRLDCEECEGQGDFYGCKYFWTIEEHEVRDSLDFEDKVDSVKGYDNFEGYDI